MNQQKQNAKEAKNLSLDLQQKAEIDQKLDYYKSILKAYEDITVAIEEKISKLQEATDADSVYQRSKLVIEKLETENAIYEKKKFFEMWLNRSTEYDKKFAIITKDCNDNFEETQKKAKELAKDNLKLKAYIDKFEKEQEEGKIDQKIKNEYYLFLKYEVSKITGKGTFAVNS